MNEFFGGPTTSRFEVLALRRYDGDWHTLDVNVGSLEQLAAPQKRRVVFSLTLLDHG